MSETHFHGQGGAIRSAVRAPGTRLHSGGAVRIHDERDVLLTSFGKDTLSDRYLLPGESYQDLFARVATAYSDDAGHAQRLYDYMSRLWFMPATPVLSNGGTGRGLPISCFLNSVPDSIEGIVAKWSENVWLAAKGGGIGTYWGDVRSIGEKVKGSGLTSGIIPFVHVQNALTLAISQGSLRRGAGAVYLDVHHPEVEEFLEIRKTGGDLNRKALNLHHGLCVTDEFMEAVRDDREFELRSPKDGSVVGRKSARAMWQRVLETRLQTGEPYLLFVDHANRGMADHQRVQGLRVRQSNLCSEVLLHSGVDHLGRDRTAVCCLSSLNLEKWDEWQDHSGFVHDVMLFLDNVLQDFIDRAPPEMAAAVYSAARERSVGLGVMGFHSFLQSKGVAFESAMAKSWNRLMFKSIRMCADRASRDIALEKGACPDADDIGVEERFSHKMSVAPTASISIICGGTSAGIEPIPANVYVHKTLSGSEEVRSPHLERLIEDVAHQLVVDEDWVEEQWSSILENGGSVQHLSYLSDDEKAVFKTAFEIDQRWVVELASDRAPMIDQGQSVNLFLRGDVDKWDLHMLHYRAWELGVKSLYYLRSRSMKQAAHAGSEESVAMAQPEQSAPTDYEECLACQ